MDQLLKLLSENARFTNKELAVMLKTTESDIDARITEFEKTGVIRGYKTLLDYEKTAEELVTALIQVNVTPQRDAGFEEIAESIMLMPEVETVYLMSGGYDLTVVVQGKSFKDVAMFVAKRLAPMKNVTSTATHFVLRRYKELGASFSDVNCDDRELISP